MIQPSPAAPEGAAIPEETTEMSITAPVSALGGAKVGDMVSLKVVSVDGDMATLAVASEEPENVGGTEGMADEFQSAATAPTT